MVDVHGNEVAFMDCPFCGAGDMTIEDARAPDDGLFVYCHLCLAQGPLHESRLTAALGWLNEWRDAGGNPEDVVLAVGDLAREIAREIIEKQGK
jgi:hypothetical protein